MIPKLVEIRPFILDTTFEMDIDKLEFFLWNAGSILSNLKNLFHTHKMNE